MGNYLKMLPDFFLKNCLIQSVQRRIKRLRNQPRDQHLYVVMHIPKCAGATIAHHIEHRYFEERLDFYQHRQKIAALLDETDKAFLQKEWERNLYYLRRDWAKRYIETFSAAQRKAMHCVYGHLAYYGAHELFDKPYRYITFLRNPVSRFISYYNHMLSVRPTPQRLQINQIQQENGKILTIDEWLEEADLNRYSMTTFLAQLCRAQHFLDIEYTASEEDFAAVKEMLRNLYFVGLTENEEDRDFVFDCLEIDKFLPNKNVLQDKATYIRPKDMEYAKQVVALKCPMDDELYQLAIQMNHEIKSSRPDFARAVSRTRSRRNAQQSASYRCEH